MGKTVAVISSLDTKEAEVAYIRELTERLGYSLFIIDIGARRIPGIVPDVTARDIVLAAGNEWDNIYGIPRHEMVEALIEGLKKLILPLYKGGKFDAILSVGGLQNTMVAVEAMKTLPIGLPKLVVSTVACGQRTFEPLVGTKDIIVIPSVADLTGINKVTGTILSNAVAAIGGMLEHAGNPLDAGKELVIGATLMGVTNDGVANAVRLLEKANCQVVSFHATGVGGRTMEEFVDSGVIHAVMDLTLHEITAEMFGGGFSWGAQNRLEAACRAGIPQVVAPGGLDFIDYALKDLPADLDGRKCVMHNPSIVHIKLKKNEAVNVANIVADRLNESRGPVTMVIPLRGFRDSTAPSEPLYAPEIDAAIIDTFHRRLRPGIRIVDVDANLNDERFSRAAAEEMLKLISKFGDSSQLCAENQTPGKTSGTVLNSVPKIKS